MSDASPSGAETRATPPLSEVMLAMDVVDTLRAQRSLVETELDDEARARAFADRIKEIYASQGIDVPDAVIREAVEALEQDRFTYTPPERTLQVRLAEIYIDRGVWFRRVAGLLLIVGLIWGAVAWSQGRRNQALERAFVARQGILTHDVETTSERIEALRRRLAEAGRDAPPDGVVAGLIAQASALLDDVVTRFRVLSTGVQPLDAAAYPKDQRAMDARLETRRRAVIDVQEDLGRVEGQLDAVRRLESLDGRITMALAQLAGLTLTADQQVELDRLQSQAEAALAAGDVTTAEARVDELRTAVSTLLAAAALRRRIQQGLAAAAADLAGMDIEADAVTEADQLRRRVSAALEAGDLTAADVRLASLRTFAAILGAAYELHIISRPGERSGVWRHPVGSPDVRNYYILVEPIGSDGQAISILVRNEEDQTSRSVKRVGIRVLERVFDAVKADKQDNGIVDRKVFGVKRRGAREPEYRYEVVGGWITDW